MLGPSTLAFGREWTFPLLLLFEGEGIDAGTARISESASANYSIERGIYLSGRFGVFD